MNETDMASKPTQNKKFEYKVGDRINVATFRLFIEHFPNFVLRRHRIERLSFFAIAHALIAHGKFESGENFRLSQVAIADISGASRPTVAKVLTILEKTGALKVADLSKRPGGGKPVKNYTLIFSRIVQEVIEGKDRNWRRDEWKREDRNVKHKAIAMSTTSPLNVNHKPSQCKPQDHKRNVNDIYNESEVETSPTPSALMPSARAGRGNEDRPSDQEVELPDWLLTAEEKAEQQPSAEWGKYENLDPDEIALFMALDSMDLDQSPEIGESGVD